VVAVLDAIGALLVHNSAPLRALVQRHGLLNLRAEIIAHLLQIQRIEPETTRFFVLHFDVHQLAHHDDFRACHGLLRLTLALHQAGKENLQYRTRLLLVLRVASKVEQHALTLRDLFAQNAPSEAEADALFQRFLQAGDEDFLSSYLDDSTHEDMRTRVTAALHQRLLPYDTRFKTAYARVQSEHQVRRERARSAASRASAERWAQCAQVEQRCRRLAALGSQSMRQLLFASNEVRSMSITKGDGDSKATVSNSGTQT